MRQDTFRSLAGWRSGLVWRRLIAVAVLAVPCAALPQGDARSTADSIIQVALSRARAGDTSAALKMLETAEKVAPNYAPTYYQSGVLISRSTRLGMSDLLRRRRATQEIKKALDLDENNPFYLMELGRIRLKTPFLRLDAERLFNHALKAAKERRDPKVLAEVEWELGQIHERRYLSTADRRTILSSAITFDPGEAINDWHYTKNFLDNETARIPDSGELDFRKAEDCYRAALDADSTHVGAATGLLTLMYDAGRYEEVENIARALSRLQPTEPRLRFALGLALHRQDRDVQAQAELDTAFSLLPTDERNAMTGLETILRKEDAKRYDTLSAAGRSALDSLYWDIADPMKLTPVNEARVEFLARVAYADLRWSSAEFNTRGWQTDRGQIFIRYGPAPEVATFAPETQDLDFSDTMGKVTTVWYYPDSKLRFVFVGPPAMNYAYFAGDFRAFADNARYLAPVSFDNLNARSPIDTIAVQIARFRGNTPNQSDVSIFADIPTTRMMKTIDLNQSEFEMGFFLSDARRRLIARSEDSSMIRLHQRDDVTSRSWRRDLASGEYLYRVEARLPASGRNARGLASFKVGSFPPGEFTLSDILVARHLLQRNPATPPRDRNDFLITPNASLTVASKDTAYLYWEDYGATPDSAGNAHLRVELGLRMLAVDRGREWSARVLGGIVDAVGLSAKGDDRVSLQFERTVPVGTADRIPNNLALDLGDAPAGTYALELTVTDLVSKRIARQVRTLYVPRS